MSAPRTLTLDIETAPALADVWSLWDVNVGLSQLRQVSTVICFAAKWHGQRRVEFASDFHDGHDEMVARAHALVDEADIVIHYNGGKFDMPHLRREFLLAGLTPPSPVLEIDLLKVARTFRFMSHKLEHVATQLGIGSKVKHAGHALWQACMAGDEKAWAQMRRYNVGDVRLTEELYDKVRPWIKNHPHMGLFIGEEHACNRCGSTDLERRGFAHTPLSSYQQYRCRQCGGWSRGKAVVARVDERGTA